MSDRDKAAVELAGALQIVPAMLDAICRATGMGFAAVARVTNERWIACAVLDHIAFGLKPGGELDLKSTICNEIREHRRAVVIPDVNASDEFRDHHTPAMYGFRSYISFPIFLPNGEFFGTLCAIDPNPANLDRPEILTTFEMFSQLLGFHLSISDRLELVSSDLRSEQRTSGMREQFIAIVGHDLRNPLASVQAGLLSLGRNPTEEKRGWIITSMQASVDRMAHLINDLLDFARGRLGDGIRLDLRSHDVSPIISQVIGELVTSHPNREVIVRLAADQRVVCDIERISQLASNLVGNALAHGAKDEPITVDCRTEADVLLISVANGGEEIPQSRRDGLFHPFAGSSDDTSRDGLGLGLFIVSEIAKAHGGTVGVESTADETRFTFTMPIGSAA